ncbi:MAG: trigger factor family protein, partial [Okeania sp. SIO3B5]|uniref:hypothetical protein n=1 Tax=Okeania sp. SIO3B5 TaxID=2607811 RepID=UPI0013FFDA43
DDHKLQPIGPINNDETSTDTGLKLVTSFDVRPSFDLPEATKLTVSTGDTSASDEDKKAVEGWRSSERL